LSSIEGTNFECPFLYVNFLLHEAKQRDREIFISGVTIKYKISGLSPYKLTKKVSM
jgi:hypothetical protein